MIYLAIGLVLLLFIYFFINKSSNRQKKVIEDALQSIINLKNKNKENEAKLVINDIQTNDIVNYCIEEVIDYNFEAIDQNDPAYQKSGVVMKYHDYDIVILEQSFSKKISFNIF